MAQRYLNLGWMSQETLRLHVYVNNVLIAENEKIFNYPIKNKDKIKIQFLDDFRVLYVNGKDYSYPETINIINGDININIDGHWDPSFDRHFFINYIQTEEEIALKHYIGEESNLTIPDGIKQIRITKIKDGDFNDNFTIGVSSTLRTISNNTIEYIGNAAFYNCSLLESVTFPNCTYIGSNVFRGNFSLINFPSCSYIGEAAFAKCSSLISISLPICKEIESYAFSDCLSLKNVGLPLCSNIKDYAFKNCVELSKIELPYCKKLGSYIFDQCFSLKEIAVAIKVSSDVCLLGENAFNSCINLTSIYVPSEDVSLYKTYPN